MRIKLIAPALAREKAKRLEGAAFQLPPLALPVIAGLTPPHHEIELLDENIEKIDFNSPADLVGITSMTSTAPRAYEIADRFRKLGAKVVMGGMHASALPEEALQHADSVVIGEAEGVWPRLLSDLERGELKPIYKNEQFPELKGLPRPRYDLLNSRRYTLTSVTHVSRGCPNACSFCTVTRFFGRRYRFRPIEDVIREVRGFKSRFVGFFDDNIAGSPPYAESLFDALKRERIMWASQASVAITKNRRLLKKAAESGCKGLFIGFESIHEEGIEEIHKPVNRKKDFYETIKILHDHGIVVMGSFIFGLDTDPPDICERTLDFVMESNIDLVQFCILTPFPGTPLYEKLKKEGRILHHDWSKYDIGNTVFRPKNFDPDELKEKVDWMWREFYSGRKIMTRILKLGKRFLFFAIPMLFLNYAFKRMVTLTQR
ncbi:B12-binding domain-containing radical SAM protein [candidate division WOR-3 bacterium]|uniref:B12-binding domain-containing radical SAM protein n=1 Tax=candidate division WOR-3 bacterium TaxID=2052148 RepID=A0A660SLT6_UNCW3|nr:MAG: B12-binding domain-containing radical SAM protein [candidate division WOR-3 bacterium]